MGNSVFGGMSTTRDDKKSLAYKLRRNLREYSLLFLCFVLVSIASLLSPKFLTFQNLMNILQQSSIVGIVGVGMTFVILVAEIDLSVGSVVALGGMVVAILLKAGVAAVWAILAAVMTGVILGIVNGLLVTAAGVPSFIVTLGMMVAARGFTLLLTDGIPVFGLPQGFRFFGAGFIGPFPVSGIMWILITVISAWVLRFLPFGRSLYAIGGNAEAARLSGILVKRSKIWVFAICSALAGFGGVILASWLTVGQPTAAQGLELTAIAAVVLGGTNLFGGSGGVLGTLIGVFLMNIITNIFNLLGLSSYYQSIFMGAIIVLAVVFNSFLGKDRSRG